MTARARTVASALLLLAWGALALAGAGPARQDAAKPAAPKPAVEVKAAEVRPPSLGPREKSGVVVFLVWTWLAIGVLLYILALKVREADRVHRTGLYGPPDGGKEPRRP